MTAVGRAREGQRDGGREHGPDLLEAGGEPALEEDQCERDDPDRAGELVVVEVDPTRPVGADRHAEPEHEDQPGEAQPHGQQRGAEAADEQGPGDQ